MRALKLLNRLSLGNKLFVAGLVMGLGATANASELVNTVLSDSQHQANRCDSSTANWRTEQKDFALACADAGLGGIASCERKLENCASKDNKPSYCIGDATSRADYKEDQQIASDERERLQDRKDALLEDFREMQSEIQNAKDAQVAIAEDIQQTLANNEDAKVQRQLELEATLQGYVDQAAATRDAKAIKELELNALVVENEMECRQQATAERTRYIQLTRNKKLTVNQAFNSAGLSINERGSIRYEHVLRNCKALYTSTGKITAFGSQYRFRSKGVNLEKARLDRTLANLETSKALAVRNTKYAIARLDQQKAAALVSYQNQNASATARLFTLQQQANQTLAEYKKLDGEINILGRRISGDQVRAVTTLAAAGLTNSESGRDDEEKVAKQDKIDAFNKALSLKDLIDNAEEDKHEVCGTQAEAASLSAALDSVDGPNITIDNSVIDITTATATPIEDPTREPASAGETL